MRLHVCMSLLPCLTIALAALVPLLAALHPPPPAAAGEDGEFLVYIGTYTGHESKGIYAYRFDARSGKLTPLGLAVEAKNPSFLAVHPNRRFLYAVNEVERDGTASAFSIDAVTGKLTLLNQAPTLGDLPCYISLDHTGRAAFIANYASGSYTVRRIGDDGTLGEVTGNYDHDGFPPSGPHADSRRQDKPHAHSFDISPDNRYVLGADLGLDKLFTYTFDPAEAGILPTDQRFVTLQQGAGPRHAAFHPNGKFVYVADELNSTVSVVAYNAADGTLSPLRKISTLPADFKGENYPAEIAVHPNGKFLYVSNRGFDTITQFDIDPESGELSPVEQVSSKGKWPRNFAIDPTGAFMFVANEKSGNVTVFRIHPKTGRLSPAGQSFHVPSPACVRFVPSR